MRPHPSGKNTSLDSSQPGLRGAEAALVTLLFILSPLVAIVPSTTTSDPGAWDDGDMTRSVLWNFTDEADYDLYDSTVSGGVGTLASVNETAGENSTDQYLLGTGTNLDLAAVPDSMIIDNASLPVQTIILQPGPEGSDNYLDEWFPYWSPPEGGDLMISSQYDPDPASSKRSRIIAQFNLTSVPVGATVTEATLLLYQKAGKGTPTEYTIRAVTSFWNEIGVSWRTRDAGGVPWSTVGGDFSAEAFAWGAIEDRLGWHTFDLTRLVDLWVRNAIPNYGFIIVSPPGPVDDSKTFTDCEITNKPEQRPTLMINYTLGEASAAYESAALGPGTNSTFTLASWTDSIYSKASDEFDGSSLSPKWEWTNDPALSSGSVNFDTSGWINVTGSQPTYLPNATVGCNFLHQDITGYFTAETHVQAYFSSDSMGAGLMMMSDSMTWLSIYLTGAQGSERVVAQVSKSGTNTSLGSASWSGSNAFLRIERGATGYVLSASADGSSWNTVGSHVPAYDFDLGISVGLCIFSGGSASQPIAMFDFARILPTASATALDVSVRTGNSTLLTDPSWGSWSAALSPDTGALVGSTGMYVQYMVALRTSYDWATPMFSAFECHYERFAPNGTITTGEVAPYMFETWESMTVTQTLASGSIEYLYSTDHGASWTSLGSGSSFALSVSIQTLMIRAELSTTDTISTPSIDTIEVVYRITHALFYVEAPTMVVAGQTFSVYIEPKDTDNNTATWTGTVTLHAVDSLGVGDASSELAVTQADVPTGGHLMLNTQRYNVAETIRVLVSGGGATGISQTINVVAGPPSSITIEPNVTSLSVNSNTVFTASVCDSLGNSIPGITLTWSADPGLGLLNTTTGNSVNLTTVMTASSGYLTVTAMGLSESLFITVLPLSLPPEIDPNIPAQTKPEDFGSWTLDLSPYVSDLEDGLGQLRWYVLNDTVVTVTGENHTGSMLLTFTTVQDMSGTNALDLWVVDSDQMSSKGTIDVEITPVNDPPKIEPIDPIVVRYDDPYQYDLHYYVTDADTPPEELTIWVDAESSPYAYVSNLWLTLLYPEALNGTQQTVFLSVFDGQYIASTVIKVTVSDDQVPRALGALPEQIMLQGEVKRGAFDLDNYFTDPDGSNLYYANGNTHVGVIISLNHTVDFYAPIDWAGVEYIIFTAEDDEGARAEGALRMTVLEVNKPPTISNVPDLVVRFGLRYDFDLSPYIEDPEDDAETLVVTVDDSHAWTTDYLLSMSYPGSMIGMTVPVNITVSDGVFSDWWTINVTISSDYPPEIAAAAPDHSFLEDNPISYPVLGGLEDFFTDRDDDPLTYSVLVSAENITADLVYADGDWSIEFDPEGNWSGVARLTMRATDPDGALAETTVTLTVVSVADEPVLTLPDSFTVTQGSRSLLEVNSHVLDPDSALTDFRWELDSDYGDYISIHGGIMVLDFPLGFLSDGEKSRDITVTVTVSDQDNLVSIDHMNITVERNVVVTNENLLPWLALLGSVGAVAGLSAFAIIRRKKPFLLHDLMLIHNDGFLITRYAKHQEQEIDQDVLTGMLTAVLNFVEDSTENSKEELKTFGFKEWTVMVERGKRIFVAVVYEGDAPNGIDEALREFLGTIEKIYKKKLRNWTGDMESDFAGIDVLIQAFVKEHAKKSNDRMIGVWKLKPGRGKIVTPRRTRVLRSAQEIVPETKADSLGQEKK